MKRYARVAVIDYRRDLAGISWAPYQIWLACGHRRGGTHRQAHAKTNVCRLCPVTFTSDRNCR